MHILHTATCVNIARNMFSRNFCIPQRHAHTDFLLCANSNLTDFVETSKQQFSVLHLLAFAVQHWLYLHHWKELVNKTVTWMRSIGKLFHAGPCIFYYGSPCAHLESIYFRSYFPKMSPTKARQLDIFQHYNQFKVLHLQVKLLAAFWLKISSCWILVWLEVV